VTRDGPQQIIGAMRQGGQGTDASRAGVAMAALLVGLSIMAIMMTVALPAWSHAVRREREIELVWRGEQYQRAIRLFQRRFANTFPPTVDLLVEQKFLRKRYKDPITGGDFQVIPVGAVLGPGVQGTAGAGPGTPRPGLSTAGTPPTGGIGLASATALGAVVPQGLGLQGVVSKSRDKAIRIYNGATTYDAWFFIGTAAGQAGAVAGGAMPNAARPGLPQSTEAPGGPVPFGRPTSPPPATPLFGTPQPSSPFQALPSGTTVGMAPTGNPSPIQFGYPVFGGAGSRPPVAPPPAWRPR